MRLKRRPDIPCQPRHPKNIRRQTHLGPLARRRYPHFRQFTAPKHPRAHRPHLRRPRTLPLPRPRPLQPIAVLLNKTKRFPLRTPRRYRRHRRTIPPQRQPIIPSPRTALEHNRPFWHDQPSPRPRNIRGHTRHVTARASRRRKQPEETLLAIVDAYRQEVHLTRSKLMSLTLARIRQRELRLSGLDLQYMQDLATPMTVSCTRQQETPETMLDRRTLWRFAISGE